MGVRCWGCGEGRGGGGSFWAALNVFIFCWLGMLCSCVGLFFLDPQGHAACIQYVRRFGKPVMLLGGGGYTPRNVARCWTYETSVVVGGDELDNDLPFNDYYGRWWWWWWWFLRPGRVVLNGVFFSFVHFLVFRIFCTWLQTSFAGAKKFTQPEQQRIFGTDKTNRVANVESIGSDSFGADLYGAIGHDTGPGFWSKHRC